MISKPKRFAGLAAAVLAAGALAACSSSSTSSPTTSSSSSKPVSGGTLNIVSASGPAHIDTVPAYYTVDYQIEHATTRQLLSYPTEVYDSFTSPGWTADITPVPDAATEVPSTANGGITNSGKTYTFHIKPGVDWNTSPPRQVTSQDFLREFKAFFNPVSPVGNPVYYESTIAGLTAYANAETAYFTNKSHAPTAANIANFQNTHSISGITTPNSSTIQFTLISPASDFLYMLAMPFASARPVEYDSYVPNSLQLDQHTIADGPYQITSYTPGKSLTLGKNPAWKQSTDSLRHQYVDKVVDTFGVTSAETQLSDLQAGTEDIIDSSTDDQRVVDSVPDRIERPQLRDLAAIEHLPVHRVQPAQPGCERCHAKAAGTAGGQLRRGQGGRGEGHRRPGHRHHPQHGDHAGQHRIRELQHVPGRQRAGQRRHVQVRPGQGRVPERRHAALHVPERLLRHPDFTAIQASLANCGITLTGKPEPGSSFFTDLGNSPENNKPGQWDMGQPGWFPDWFGNNGRTVVQALFQGPNCVINTVNYGCYDSATVNSLITKAEGASSLQAAGNYWHQADVQIMSDAVITPIMDQNIAGYSSARVRGITSTGQTFRTAIFQPNIGAPDITALWLTNG